MQENWDKIYGYLIQYGINLLAAVVIFILGKWAAQIVSKIVDKSMTRSKINRTLVTFAKDMVYFIILAFAVIAALNKLGVETTSFIAVLGAAGLAVGLALQGSLSNFAAGVMLIIFQPFHVGSTVEAGGALGVVEEIQIFNTIIVTSDGKRIIVPNAKITGDKITVFPAEK
ncbi:MAG: mechanosensitive ion channel domain-containing protein [Candidatus Omnitrophota bacterium]